MESMRQGMHAIRTRLKSGAMIDTETGAGRTVITIRNYDTYQLTAQNSDANRDGGLTQDRRTKEKTNQSNTGNEKSSEA